MSSPQVHPSSYTNIFHIGSPPPSPSLPHKHIVGIEMTIGQVEAVPISFSISPYYLTSPRRRHDRAGGADSAQKPRVGSHTLNFRRPRKLASVCSRHGRSETGILGTGCFPACARHPQLGGLLPARIVVPSRSRTHVVARDVMSCINASASEEPRISSRYNRLININQRSRYLLCFQKIQEVHTMPRYAM